MLDLLTRVVELIATYPGISAGLGAAALVTAVYWGVMNSSYRYR